jgi:CHAT domain-containing protein/Tfp pilus assembly protein PilF
MNPPADSDLVEIQQRLAQGAVWFERKNWQQVIETLGHGLALAQQKLPPDHELYSALVINLADAHMNSENFGMAEELVSDQLQRLGKNKAEGARLHLQNVLANIYIRTQRFEKAKAVLVESIRIRQKESDETHPSLIPDYHLLALSYLNSRRVVDAKALLPKMEEMRQRALRGYPEGVGLAQLVADTFRLLGVPFDLPPSPSKDHTAGNEPQPNPDAFFEREAECWGFFINRDFATAAHCSLELLVSRVTLRLVEIRLLSLLAIGSAEERDGNKALAVVPDGSWAHAVIEFTLGRISLAAVLELANGSDELCQTWFYAGMLALAKGQEEQGRECFERAMKEQSETPEHAQAAIEREAMDFLARDISALKPEEQAEVRQACRQFALFDLLEFVGYMTRAGNERVFTPQLLLLEIITLRTLGQVELSDSLVPVARRQLRLWPWHARLIDLLTGRVPAQSLLSTPRDLVTLCQLHYYAMVQRRLAGQWEEAAIHRAAALQTQASCFEYELAGLDGSDPVVMLTNISRQLPILADNEQLALAEQLGRVSLAVARGLPSPNSALNNLLANLAAILGKQGKISESIRAYDELEAIPSLSKRDRFFHALNAGQLYLDHGFLSEANRFLRKAAGLRRSLQLDPLVKAALSNALGLLAMQTGHLATALRRFEEAASEFEPGSPEAPLLRAAVADNWGQALNRAGRHEQALMLQQEAYDRISQATKAKGGFVNDAHSSIGKILVNLAWTLTRLGRYPEAQQRVEQALQLPALEQGAEPVRRGALIQIALILAVTGRPAEALEALFKSSALADQEIGEIMALPSNEMRMSYIEHTRLEFSLLLSILSRLPSPETKHLKAVLDVVIRRKALAAEVTTVRRDSVLGGRYPRLRPLLEELGSLESEIAAIALATSRFDAPAEATRKLSAKRDRANWIEASLAREIPELRLNISLHQLKAERVFEHLPRAWSVIEFVRAPFCDLTSIDRSDAGFFAADHYWAFVVPASDLSLLTLVDLGPANELDQIIQSYLTHLGNQRGRRGQSSRRGIRERLVDPVFSNLPATGHLLVAPDGVIAQLPFEVLPDTENGFAVDKYTVSYLATSRDLLRQLISWPGEPGADVVVADPDFNWSSPRSAKPNAKFEPLPGTRKEGLAIGKILGVEPWLAADARKSKLMALSAPRVLHLATHGFFDEEPSRGWQLPLDLLVLPGEPNTFNDPLHHSGLALAGANLSDHGEVADDGLLTASDVTGMNLAGTQLVVLSACETGLGKVQATEGVIGLRRAFQLAGARTVIASLWRVPDEQTYELMTGFYRRLLDGMSRVDALRAAQLELREKVPSPFFWGAFVCYGETGPVEGMEVAVGYDASENRIRAQRELQDVKELSLLIEMKPASSDLFLERAISYHNLHRLVEAIADFDRAAELAPDLPLVYFSRGFSYHSLKRFDDALKDFDRALKLNPNFAPAYHRRGNTLSILRHDDAALRDLTRAIELEPANADIWYDRAGYFADRGMSPQALADYDEAIRLRPAFQTAYVNRATVLLELDRFDEAITSLETAIQLVPSDGVAHLNLGSAYVAVRNPKAIRSFEEAMRYGNAEVVQAAQQMLSQFSDDPHVDDSDTNNK